MNNPKPSATKEKVIELYLYGLSTQEIANKCSVSLGFVSGVIQTLREELGRNEVAAIREFAVAARKLGIMAPQAAVGVKIYSILSKSGIDEDKLAELISEVIEKSQNQKIPLSELIQYCKTISELQEKSDTPLKDLPMVCQELLEKKEILEEENSNLSKKKADAEFLVKNVLEEKDLTIKKIEEFDMLKTKLEENHLDTSDLHRLVAVLKKGSEENYDLGKIIDHLQKEEQHQSRVEKLEHQEVQLRSSINTQTKALEKITKEIEEKKSLVTAIKSLEKCGITQNDLQVLYQTVLGIAEKHNVSPNDALMLLGEDLKTNYDRKLGLKNHLEKLESDISDKTSNLQSIQKQESEFLIKHEDDLETLQILKNLRKHGIGDVQILEWSKLLDFSKLDVSKFSKQIRIAGSLAKAKIGMEKERSLLQRETERLKIQKNILEKSIAGHESRLDQYEKIVKSSLDDLLNDALKRINFTESHATRAIDDISAKTSKSLEKYHEKAVNSLKEQISGLDEFIEKSLIESKKIGKQEWLVEVYEFLIGNNRALSRNIPIVIRILEGLLDCMKNKNIDSSFESHIKQVIVDLENMMRKND